MPISEKKGTMPVKASPVAYYSSHIFDRRNELSTILRSSHLFQNVSVDTYCKIDGESLSYVPCNQNGLRAADYTRLTEYLRDKGEAVDEGENCWAGRLIVLPTTFTGGESYMTQQIFDIIAISKKAGHPDIFFTMNCNPKRKETTKAVLPGQMAPDRPDKCTRRSHLKLEALLHIMNNQDLFGNTVSLVRISEFQKRRLLHTHCIFSVDRVSTQILNNSHKVDRIICTKLPGDEDLQPQEIIEKHIIHTSCGISF